jgi:hypothetical protein
VNVALAAFLFCCVIVYILVALLVVPTPTVCAANTLSLPVIMRLPPHGRMNNILDQFLLIYKQNNREAIPAPNDEL